MAFFAAKSISQKFSLTARQNQVLFLIMAALLIVAVLIAMGRLPAQFILAPLGGLGAFDSLFAHIDEASSFLADGHDPPGGVAA